MLSSHELYISNEIVYEGSIGTGVKVFRFMAEFWFLDVLSGQFFKTA